MKGLKREERWELTSFQRWFYRIRNEFGGWSLTAFCDLALPRWLSYKESACQWRDKGDIASVPGSGRSCPRRRKWQPTSVFLLRKSHGQRSLMGYSPWGRDESDLTEWLSTHAYLETQWRGISFHVCLSLECGCLKSSHCGEKSLLSIWLFSRYLLSTCCVPSTVLCTSCLNVLLDLNSSFRTIVITCKWSLLL